MKNNKKILWLKFLTAILLAVQVTSPVYADISVNKEKTSNISFEKMEEILEEHNTNLKIANNILKQSKDNYDDICDDIDDLEKLQKENNDKIKNLYSQKNGIKDEDKLKETDESIKVLKFLSSDISNKIDELENKRDKLKYSIRIQKDQYNVLIKDLLFKAQNQYIQCLILNNKEAYLKNKISYEKSQSDIYKYKLDCGFISQKEFEKYNILNMDLNNQLEKVTNDKDLALKNLKNILGISKSENIDVSPDILMDLDNIKRINLVEDTKKMLENNLNIHMKKIELDCADDLSDDDYEIDNAELKFQQEKNNAAISFETQYNLVIESYNAIKNNEALLTINNKSMKVMNDTYLHGFNSKNKLNKIQLDLEEQNNNLDAEINTFYVNYSRYIQMKMGY